jgi:hypothetical protein
MHFFQTVDFYFAPHQDDWQLFMEPEIGRSIADKTCKTVLIHTTAGDAGRGEKYWKAREQAALASLLFRLSTDPAIQCPHGIKLLTGSSKHVHFDLSNCSCYFLRLPDGGFEGNGFAAYSGQSLGKLRTGIIQNMASVDQNSVYASWSDLVQTIDHIIETELALHQAGPEKKAILNIPESDPVLNPWDHNDHYNTSMLVQATKAFGLYPKRSFITYELKNTNDMLAGEDLFWKIGMFSAYQHSLLKEVGHSTLMEDAAFIPWCFRNSSYRNLR